MGKQQYHDRGISSQNIKYGIQDMIPFSDLTLYVKDEKARNGWRRHSTSKAVYVHSIDDQKGITIINKTRQEVYLEGGRWYVNEKEVVHS